MLAILLTPLADTGGLAFQSEKAESVPSRSGSEDISEDDGGNDSEDHTLPEEKISKQQ